MVGNRNYCERNNNPQMTTFMRSGVDTIFERRRVNDDNNFRQLHIGTSVDCSQQTQQTAIRYYHLYIYILTRKNINSAFDLQQNMIIVSTYKSLKSNCLKYQIIYVGL